MFVRCHLNRIHTLPVLLQIWLRVVHRVASSMLSFRNYNLDRNGHNTFSEAGLVPEALFLEIK